MYIYSHMSHIVWYEERLINHAHSRDAHPNNNMELFTWFLKWAKLQKHCCSHVVATCCNALIFFCAERASHVINLNRVSCQVNGKWHNCYISICVCVSSLLWVGRTIPCTPPRSAEKSLHFAKSPPRSARYFLWLCIGFCKSSSPHQALHVSDV